MHLGVFYLLILFSCERVMRNVNDTLVIGTDGYEKDRRLIVFL